jgi:hypothetical protein
MHIVVIASTRQFTYIIMYSMFVELFVREKSPLRSAGLHNDAKNIMYVQRGSCVDCKK